MSSDRTLTDVLGAMSDSYEASDAIKQALRHKEMVPLIGPFAVGKTTLMRATERFDRTFGRVRSFTTRPRRSGEDHDTYDFLPHSIATLNRIYTQAVGGKLVQFIVHPTTGNVYGSTLASYGAIYSMLDAIPSALPGLESLPFRRITKVAVAVPANVWEGRIAERLQSGDASDIRKRLAEGVANITWSLDQGHNLAWVVNDARDINNVARDLIHVVKNGCKRVALVHARNVASELLTRMKALQA